MLFKKHNLQKVMKGEKTQTRRLGKIIYQVGRVYGIRAGWFTKSEVHIIITRRHVEKLGDISSKDVKKEGYENRKAFVHDWIKINGTWKPDKKVIVYDFRVTRNHTKPLVLNGFIGSPHNNKNAKNKGAW